MICANCGKETETSIYGLSISLDFVLPMGNKIEHETLWGSKPYCSMECLQVSILIILDDINNWAKLAMVNKLLFKQEILDTMRFNREKPVT